MTEYNPGEVLLNSEDRINSIQAIHNSDSLLQSLNPLLSKQFSKLNVDDLKDRCKKYGISGFSKLKKNELIDVIIKKSTSDSGQLYNLKLDELKALCKQNNLSGYSSLKKDELISYISLNNILNPQEISSQPNVSNVSNVSNTLKDLLNRIDDFKRERQDSKILFHCYVGVSRSATVAIAYLAKSENKTIQEIYELTKHKRPRINPNETFRKMIGL